MVCVSGMRLLVLCSVTIVSACAGNGAGLDANGQLLGSGSAPPPPLTADFQSIQDNVFTPICVRCHSGAGVPQGPELDAAHSYALLVGVPSNEQSGLLRVKPGAPDSSYLVLKLEGAAGIVGVQMPFGGPPLPQSTIDVIRQWISDGAANSPAAAAVSSAAFAVTAISPAQEATVAAPLTRMVVAFNHELDASLVNDTTVHLEHLLGEAAEPAGPFGAEPYLAVGQGPKCSQCHVNPTGGGLRNAFGNVFAQTQLPAHRVDTGSDVWAGQLSRYLALGADLRFDAQAQQVPHSKTLEDF